VFQGLQVWSPTEWGISCPTSRGKEKTMIILGIVLLLLGVLLDIQILTTVGIIVLVVGAVLFLAGSFGRPVMGRRHYW
jgi:uncharacterized membrane protein HdeD (DUF308 family)